MTPLRSGQVDAGGYGALVAADAIWEGVPLGLVVGHDSGAGGRRRLPADRRIDIMRAFTTGQYRPAGSE